MLNFGCDGGKSINYGLRLCFVVEGVEVIRLSFLIAHCH